MEYYKNRTEKELRKVYNKRFGETLELLKRIYI